MAEEFTSAGISTLAFAPGNAAVARLRKVHVQVDGKAAT
jgi:hypothetical protein